MKMQMFTIYHKKNCNIWVSVKDVNIGVGVTNMSDLILKEIYGIYETKKNTS